MQSSTEKKDEKAEAQYSKILLVDCTKIKRIKKAHCQNNSNIKQITEKTRKIDTHITHIYLDAGSLYMLVTGTSTKSAGIKLVL